MKKRWKSLCSLGLTMCLLFSALPVNAMAAETEVPDEIVQEVEIESEEAAVTEEEPAAEAQEDTEAAETEEAPEVSEETEEAEFEAAGDTEDDPQPEMQSYVEFIEAYDRDSRIYLSDYSNDYYMIPASRNSSEAVDVLDEASAKEGYLIVYDLNDLSSYADYKIENIDEDGNYNGPYLHYYYNKLIVSGNFDLKDSIYTYDSLTITGEDSDAELTVEGYYSYGGDGCSIYTQGNLKILDVNLNLGYYSEAYAYKDITVDGAKVKTVSVNYDGEECKPTGGILHARNSVYITDSTVTSETPSEDDYYSDNFVIEAQYADINIKGSTLDLKQKYNNHEDYADYSVDGEAFSPILAAADIAISGSDVTIDAENSYANYYYKAAGIYS